MTAAAARQVPLGVAEAEEAEAVAAALQIGHAMTGEYARICWLPLRQEHCTEVILSRYSTIALPEVLIIQLAAFR